MIQAVAYIKLRVSIWPHEEGAAVEGGWYITPVTCPMKVRNENDFFRTERSVKCGKDILSGATLYSGQVATNCGFKIASFLVLL
jgi:hypothetical protein